jgi:polyferredoxin
MLVAFTWAVGLLSYLMPPVPLYTAVFNLEVSFPQNIFLLVATILFTLDFILARHLFCRYGCAVGLFQSLFWMMNTKAIVVSFDRDRASLCQDCDKDCEDACPMRLPVRGYKRAKFTCTQCAQCISACQNVQKDNPDGSLLDWSAGEKIKQVSLIPLKEIPSGSHSNSDSHRNKSHNKSHSNDGRVDWP